MFPCGDSPVFCLSGAAAASFHMSKRCAYVPPVAGKGDLATPPEGLVSSRSASRLTSRASRLQRGIWTPPSTTGFPWNAGCRAAALGENVTVRTRTDREAVPCGVCEGGSADRCVCGATFASGINEAALGDFIAFVRSPYNPILTDEDPWDQSLFRGLFDTMAETASTEEMPRFVVVHGVLRACTLGALSGRPEVLNDLPIGATDQLVEDTLRRRCAQGDPFFRGGQAHGKLKKALVADTFHLWISDGLQANLATCKTTRHGLGRHAWASQACHPSPFPGFPTPFRAENLETDWDDTPGRHNRTKALFCLSHFTCNSTRCPGPAFQSWLFRGQGTEAQ